MEEINFMMSLTEVTSEKSKDNDGELEEKKEVDLLPATGKS
jgi:hypothetical protein